MGFKDIHRYGPSLDPPSIISVDDFEYVQHNMFHCFSVILSGLMNRRSSPKALADYLHYLNSNDEAYLQYFEWKTQNKVSAVSCCSHSTLVPVDFTPPLFGQHFTAMVDQARVHSKCRMCIRYLQAHYRVWISERMSTTISLLIPSLHQGGG